jgi:protein-tyrosine phosphatase
LTYQHHVVDIAGGFVLAAVCFYAVRGTRFRLPVVKNLRVATYYGLGAVAAALLAAGTWPKGAWLVWPAAVLMLVMAAYCGLGPGIYRKEHGRVPLSTRVLLAPVLLGQHLSLFYYRRRCPAWDDVCPGVLIGRVLNDAEAADAVHEGVTAVLDVTAEFSEAEPFLAVKYRHLPILDLTAPMLQQLRDAVQFIAAEAEQGTVYVHCKIGYSRSAAVVGAYLLHRGLAATAEEAAAVLRKARPSIVIRPEAAQALLDFERSCAKITVESVASAEPKK